MIFGKEKDIQDECYLPKWNRFGKPNLHQVDHIVEYQLGGSDIASNYELTDDHANTNSGNAIKRERKRKVEKALENFTEAGVPNMPNYEEVNTKYITSYFKIASWDLPYDGNGKAYWSGDEIHKGIHLQHLREMTGQEIAEAQGSAQELVLYVNEHAGRPLKIKLPFAGPISDWLPGIDLIAMTLNPTPIDGKPMGTVNIQLKKDFSDKLQNLESFPISFNKTPGLINAGYLTFTKPQQA